MPTRKFPFTKQVLDNLLPEEGSARSYYRDERLPGLELSVTINGVKTFSVLKKIHQKTKRVVLGHYNPMARQPAAFDKNPICVLENNPQLTIEQARNLALAVIAQLTAGEKPRTIKRGYESDVTLGQLFDAYMDNYAREHCKTWRKIEEAFYLYLKDYKDMPVATISKTAVQQLINRIGKQVGKTTANRTHELMRAIVNKGIEFDLYTGKNPCSGVTRFRLEERERFVTEEELPRLIRAMELDENPAVRDYFILSISLGARKSNILTMRWDELDLDSGYWCIPAPKTKNGRAQTIFLTDPEISRLRARHQERKSDEWVFPGPSLDQAFTDPSRGWRRILKRANITNLRPHDLRRTLGSYMAMTGASLSVIGNALNHKDLSTTRKVYAQSARAAERAAREVAHSRIFPVPADKPPAQNVEF